MCNDYTVQNAPDSCLPLQKAKRVSIREQWRSKHALDTEAQQIYEVPMAGPWSAGHCVHLREWTLPTLT